MPTYNYYCSECDAHFSYFQKMSEIAKSNCEKCEGKINQVITGGTGLIFPSHFSQLDLAISLIF
jgi:putative FmdB family regulatory protein